MGWLYISRALNIFQSSPCGFREYSEKRWNQFEFPKRRRLLFSSGPICWWRHWLSRMMICRYYRFQWECAVIIGCDRAQNRLRVLQAVGSLVWVWSWHSWFYNSSCERKWSSICICGSNAKPLVHFSEVIMWDHQRYILTGNITRKRYSKDDTCIARKGMKRESKINRAPYASSSIRIPLFFPGKILDLLFLEGFPITYSRPMSPYNLAGPSPFLCYGFSQQRELRWQIQV